jgi:hypothetical protein
MRWLGLIWTVAAWWFLLSVISAPVFLLIRNARARSRRLFRDNPSAVLATLKADTTNSHIYDGA